MPEGFNACVRKKGRVRTVAGPSKEHGLQQGEYVHYCYLNGKAYRGEVKKAQTEGKVGPAIAAAVKKRGK